MVDRSPKTRYVGADKVLLLLDADQFIGWLTDCKEQQTYLSSWREDRGGWIG